MNATKQRLDGWKEIALHFSRSVRCVQRWERTEKLPVHRHCHARGSTVETRLSFSANGERQPRTSHIAKPKCRRNAPRSALGLERGGFANHRPPDGVIFLEDNSEHIHYARRRPPRTGTISAVARTRSPSASC